MRHAVAGSWPGTYQEVSHASLPLPPRACRGRDDYCIASSLLEAILRGPRGLRWLSPATFAMAARLLPPKLRDGFGLPWRRRTRALSRLLLHGLPAPMTRLRPCQRQGRAGQSRRTCSWHRRNC